MSYDRIKIFGNCWCLRFQKLVAELHKNNIAYEPHPLENEEERELLKTEYGSEGTAILGFPVVFFGKGRYVEGPTLAYIKQRCGK